jgi:OFA family oxalate/formate antiporter-like MFS transporter
MIGLISQAKDGSFIQRCRFWPYVFLIGPTTGKPCLFPSITKDYYGLKNFGVNYGLVFTAWGVGGFMLAFLAGKIYDIHKTFAIAYFGASVLLILAAITVFFVKPPHHMIEGPKT